MIDGKQIIGYETAALGTHIFHSVNPATGQKLADSFHRATKKEVESAAKKAEMAFQTYRKKRVSKKPCFGKPLATN